MGNPAMELSQEQKNFIGEYIRGHYQEWISPFTENRSISEREMEIRERIVRVEESLDKQYELMRQGFAQMDKRFELLTDQMNARFESITDQMNARFESITEQTNSRFEQVDKRFEMLTNQMNARFEQVDKRFEMLTNQTNSRFELLTGQMNTRFEQVDKRFNQMFAYFTTGMVLLGVLITAFQVFG
jgi:ABC-type phosphate transport system auxiliary subunit